jgi:hypothetical protein
MAGLLRDVKVAAAISIWVGALFGVLGSMLIAVLCLPHPLAMSWLTLMVRSLSVLCLLINVVVLSLA